MIISELNKSFTGGLFNEGTKQNTEYSEKERGLVLSSYIKPPVEIIEDFEGEPVLNFIGDWEKTDRRANGGTYSFKSKTIGNSGRAEATARFSVGVAGTITFDYLASSESGYDWLEIYINGERIVKSSGNNSTWSTAQSILKPGTNEIKLVYYKDGSGNYYDDAGYIDNIRIKEGGVLLEDFESSEPALVFTGDWIKAPGDGKGGSVAFRSGQISHSQESIAETTITLDEPGTVSFDYWVSSEGNYDKLNFYIDGVSKLQQGNTGWTSAKFELAAGEHTLKWRYSKDGSASEGRDAAFVDNIAISGINKPIVVYQPTGEWIGTIENNIVQRATGGSINFAYETPTGTGVKIELSKDNQTWQIVELPGELPAEFLDFKTLYIKVTLTSDGTNSPVLRSIGVNIWEESRTSANIIGRPKNINQDLIKIFDLSGELAAFLERARGIYTDDTLQESEILYFEMNINDPKAELIQYGAELEFKGRRYLITEINDGMDENGLFNFNITAEGNYIELLDKTVETIELQGVTPEEGGEKILNGTEWTMGNIEKYAGDLFSMAETKKTALWLIRQWAKIIGLEIKFDSINKKINLVERIGTNRGAGFRYRKNLKSIQRKIIPPQATVIIPYGKNGLTIGIANNDINYIENYSWYTSQGVPLSTARKKYRKEYILEDDRFISPQSLKRYAEDKLKELSNPQFSYQATVLDLAELTGLSEDRFNLGDDVGVYNEDLKINAETRILRLKRYHQEPWRNEIELGFLLPGLGDSSNTNSISSDVAAAQPDLIYMTSGTAKQISTKPVYAAQTALTNFNSTNAQIGLMLICEASQELTATIRLTMNGSYVGPEIKQKMLAGANTVGAPFILAQLPPGSGMIEAQVQTDSGTISIPTDGLQVFIYASNLLGGLSSDVPRPAIAENYELSRDKYTHETREQAIIIFEDLIRMNPVNEWFTIDTGRFAPATREEINIILE